jgi:hypothetical protein
MITHGLKDENRDIFQVWREAFSHSAVHQSIARQRGNATKTISGTTESVKKNAQQVLRGPLMQATQTMADYGDSQLILRGLFHNMLKMRYSDPSMTRSTLACDWLSSSELLESRCFGGSSDGFALMAYVPSVAGALHMLCANDSRPKIEWPTVDREQQYKQQQNAHILQSLQIGAGAGAGAASNDSDSSSGGITLSLSTLSPSLRNRTAVACDVVSHLMDIISPKVRPVAFITLGLTEQDAVTKAVQVMASTGLSYHMQRTYEANNSQSSGFGQPKPYNNHHQQQQQQQQQQQPMQTIQLVLEPAIDQLLKYNHVSGTALSNRHWKVPYETRNNIFMELKKYLIQLHAGAATANSENTASGSPSSRNSLSKSSHLASPSKGSPGRSGMSAADSACAAAVDTSTPVRRRGRSNSLTDKQGGRDSGQKRAFVVASPQATMLARQSDAGAHNENAQKKQRTSPVKLIKGASTTTAGYLHSNAPVDAAMGSVETAADFLTRGMPSDALATSTSAGAKTETKNVLASHGVLKGAGKAVGRSVAFFKGGNFVQENDRLADQVRYEKCIHLHV